ncbi:MAG TPA: PD-(D/E)XK nuclease family protein [Bacteroidales bacterium]|nr:PD-(D/E)XK nuclease family protein [Bacteroidales bacterium]HRW27504.1 PD-(D/E)XK nuclease family protein [Bacteroidales bacterium]
MDFLDRVAYRLRERYGDEMEKQTVVLPSRRAGLWLTRSLARLTDKPLWSPSLLTVSELFRTFTGLLPADSDTQIFELYNVFRKLFGEEMSFDDFWPWGEVIINDFNDIDLYMADAGKLYSNISDLKEIDAVFGGLTDEQVEIIRGFWKSFNPSTSASEARLRFRSVWQKMAPLYTTFRESMKAKGMAGDGMLCREVAEKALSGQLQVPEGRRWHIVGLNALNNCEKTLFRYLKQMGVAEFYWDDDHFFMDDTEHKASLFIRENRRIFGNAVGKPDTSLHDPPGGLWQIIDAPTDTSQARMVAQLLEDEEITGEDDPTSTAVILADEKLLMPVLGSLPPSVEDVNVTMGHPFRLTSLYSFLKQLMALIRSARKSDGYISFRSDDVLSLLRHQYFRLLAGTEGDIVVREIIKANMIRVNASVLGERFGLKQLFTVPEGGPEIPEHLVAVMENLEEATFTAETDGPSLSVDREYLRMAIHSTVRLANLIRSYSLDIKPDTCLRLLDRVFRKMIVPFSGEPLRGIQVMGVLETRALEFRNIIFLSLNEGIFPRMSYDNTYIPYNIRRAFGLPTVNEHESIYSYYFFRLLRKPARGWFLYNSTSGGLNTGEMSRYLVRMSYSPLFTPRHRTVHINVGRSRLMAESLSREQEHNMILLSRYGKNSEANKFLSPSAVNTWLNCRMRFYYRYVCGMPEEEMLEKEIDQRRFGNIMHEALRRLYSTVKGSADAVKEVSKMAGEREQIRETIIATAMDEMHWDRPELLSGKGVIIIDVLERYARELLLYDSRHSDLRLLHLEEDFTGTFTVASAGARTEVMVGGRADRIDMTDGAVRVVDYKTGAPKRDAITIEGLFDEEKDKRNDAVLQALFYCALIRQIHHGRLVLPTIYWIQQLSSADFTPYTRAPGLEGPEALYEEWKTIMSDFQMHLELTLNKIFADNEDFTMTSFRRRCACCPYRTLCRR